MAKEEKLFSVQSKLSDRDFDDVYKIYLEMERGSEKKIALIVCIILCVICIALLVITRNMTFIFYGIGCLVIGISYFLVPVNKKFIATNKLHFGEWRETGFYPHSVTTIEIFEDDETAEMTDEEIEDATTEISTGRMVAYENERAFLFADGRITVLFLYIPKRNLDEQQIADLQAFAKERCSGGYHLLEMKSMLADDDEDSAQDEDETEGESLVSEVCDQYYGAAKLRVYDEDGHRIDLDAEDEADDLPEDTAEDTPEEQADE